MPARVRPDEVLERYTRAHVAAQAAAGLNEVTFYWQGGEPTVLGIDWTLAPATAHARTAGLGVARQGNFDPCWLYAPPE